MSMDVDIACVGFGPAAGGFLTTVSRYLAESGDFKQVLCYERADDTGFGVSGVVTRARGIRSSFPDLDPAKIPMAVKVTSEKVVWLRSPGGAFELPYNPPFLRKHDGFVFSIGQFNQWVGSQIMASGMAQIWPGMPATGAIVEGDGVVGVRLQDMDVRAALTVVADGPVGAVGRQLATSAPREWALGMKMVVDGVDLEPGTVIHTIGYPEPEIFGFLYAHPGNVASVGIFVPSWYYNPARTSYRYLQQYVRHPYLWQHLRGGALRSWGAKSLNESGRAGEPALCGDGYARIGEGSGSTNVLTGSGVDEAWTTGVQLGEAVIELWKEGAAFTKANLERTYIARRRASWVESEGRVAEHARDGFHRGLLPGMIGMALAGLTKGRISIPGKPRRMPDTADGRGPKPVEYDGKLLVSHQDALLLGGKVQAGPGPDHVRFRDPALCESCGGRTCIAMCSGEAIHAADTAVPGFDREKCIHCGACLWNCPKGNVEFTAGVGGLHSAEN